MLAYQMTEEDSTTAIERYIVRLGVHIVVCDGSYFDNVDEDIEDFG